MECIRIGKNELKIKVSQNELKILDAFKNEMRYFLDDYKETCLSIIDNHLHQYLNDYTKMNELQKIKNDAIESPGFEISFLNVITLNYPKVDFLNDDLFLKFAWFTNLIDDDQIAKSKIRDYLLVHFINLSLNEYENGGLNAQKIVFQFPKENEYNPIFENSESKLFFEFLIKEWFNTLPRPKTVISFVFYLMSVNDNDLPIALRGLKYVIKDVRQLDFAYYWNENYKEIHKHKYEIIINNKTARLTTFSEIPTDKHVNKLNRFVEKFENKN
jgi:hypothetical protein